MFRPGIPLPSAQNTEAGQPRPVEDAQQPTAAERVRTLVESNGMASLSIPGVEDLDETGLSAPVCRTVTPDGDVLLLVPGDSAAARAAAYAQDDDLTAVMEITDVAPVSVPHRIRGRAWVAGWLTAVRNEQRAEAAMLLAERHPVGELLGIGEALQPQPAPGLSGRAAWMMLRLEVGEGAVDDLWGAEPVEPDEFAAAAPDPLVGPRGGAAPASAHGAQRPGARAVRAARRPVGRSAACVTGPCRWRWTASGCGSASPTPSSGPSTPASTSRSRSRDVAELRRAMHTLFEAAAE